MLLCFASVYAWISVRLWVPVEGYRQGIQLTTHSVPQGRSQCFDMYVQLSPEIRNGKLLGCRHLLHASPLCLPCKLSPGWTLVLQNLLKWIHSLNKTFSAWVFCLMLCSRDISCVETSAHALRRSQACRIQLTGVLSPGLIHPRVAYATCILAPDPQWSEQGRAVHLPAHWVKAFPHIQVSWSANYCPGLPSSISKLLFSISQLQWGLFH